MIKEFSDRLYSSFRNRFGILVAALFLRDRHLPPRERIVRARPMIRASANVFELIDNLIPWSGRPNPAFASLLRTEDENFQSSEADVAQLLYHLVRFLGARSAIEVGVYRGAGSIHLAQGLHDNGGGRLFLVDIAESALAEAIQHIETARFSLETVSVCMRSVDAVLSGVLAEVDLVFLDAEHTCEATHADIKAYLQLVRPGGLLVVHDTIMWGAADAVDALYSQGSSVFTFATSGGSGVSIFRKSENGAYVGNET